VQAEDTVLTVRPRIVGTSDLSTGAVCREAAASGKSDNDSRVMLTVDNAINPLPPPPSPHPTPDAYHNPKGTIPPGSLGFPVVFNYLYG
jgi:hypothetical protein